MQKIIELCAILSTSWCGLCLFNLIFLKKKEYFEKKQKDALVLKIKNILELTLSQAYDTDQRSFRELLDNTVTILKNSKLISEADLYIVERHCYDARQLGKKLSLLIDTLKY
jgi:hypothetical protein